jgi:hypothetical protein
MVEDILKCGGDVCLAGSGHDAGGYTGIDRQWRPVLALSYQWSG